ncbi:MAG: hypothetical protein EZS28_007983 [Streblomastix strix]|uniref:SPRY domain-containing protein n=1 Tax=Streblomastix strix TaxID=222440 RepID=A0A5J4WNJ3_9EUKA|nr:MAG: hypothetical protein EZS28_007983 [Streblomastix strix]
MAVPSEFNVIDGLIGLGPDILLEILSESRLIPDAIQFLGVNKKTVQLMKHARFLSIIETLNFLIAIINPNPNEFKLIDIDGVKKQIIKKFINATTISLSQVLEDGIWEVEMEFSDNSGSGVGIICDSLNIPVDNAPGKSPIKEYTAIQYNNDWGDDKVQCKGNKIPGNAGFKGKQKIKQQFDSEKGTLIFFIDGVQQPVYISGINEKVRFIMCWWMPGSSFIIHSLKRLLRPTSVHLENEIAIQW